VGQLHGPDTTEVASGVTWLRAPAAPRNGRAAQLRLAMGPLPNTDMVRFTVIQTYSDGKVRRWGSPAGAPSAPAPEGDGPALVLRPAEGAQPHAHGPSGSAAAAPGAAARGVDVPEGAGGPGDAAGVRSGSGQAGALVPVLGALVCVLIGMAGTVLMQRWRRASSPSGGDVAPGKAMPGDVATADVGPAAVGSGEGSPAEATPEDAGPGEAMPGDVQPATVRASRAGRGT
jgi:hypothetical protein